MERITKLLFIIINNELIIIKSYKQLMKVSILNLYI